MSDLELKAAHEETCAAWNANAAHWDERMGEGNDFVNVLIWPTLQRMLDLRAGAARVGRGDAATGSMPGGWPTSAPRSSPRTSRRR